MPQLDVILQTPEGQFLRQRRDVPDGTSITDFSQALRTEGYSNVQVRPIPQGRPSTLPPGAATPPARPAPEALPTSTTTTPTTPSFLERAGTAMEPFTTMARVVLPSLSAPQNIPGQQTPLSQVSEIAGSVAVPFLLSRLGLPPAAARQIAAHPAVSRILGAVTGGALGAIPGHFVQRAQGVPGPPLPQRMAESAALSGMGEAALGTVRPLARRVLAPYGSPPNVTRSVEEAQALGMTPSARGITGDPRLRGQQTIGAQRELAAEQSQAGQAELARLTERSKAKVQGARTPATRAKAQLGLDYVRTVVPDLVSKHTNPNTNITDLPALAKAYEKLKPSERRKIFSDPKLRAEWDRFSRVASQAIESKELRSGRGVGSTQSKWQIPAAVMAALNTGLAAGGFPNLGTTGSAVFLGTTAYVTLKPYAISALMKRPWGARWLTGALKSTRAGRNIGEGAEALARTFIQGALRDAEGAAEFSQDISQGEGAPPPTDEFATR